jgi:hypothetical protein
MRGATDRRGTIKYRYTMRTDWNNLLDVHQIAAKPDQETKGSLRDPRASEGLIQINVFALSFPEKKVSREERGRWLSQRGAHHFRTAASQ